MKKLLCSIALVIMLNCFTNAYSESKISIEPTFTIDMAKVESSSTGEVWTHVYPGFLYGLGANVSYSFFPTFSTSLWVIIDLKTIMHMGMIGNYFSSFDAIGLQLEFGDKRNNLCVGPVIGTSFSSIILGNVIYFKRIMFRQMVGIPFNFTNDMPDICFSVGYSFF